MERTQAEQIAHEPPISAPLSEGAALMLAAERGAVRSIKGWQMRGGDINAPLSHSGSTMTPLQTAAHAGYTLAVRTLLQCGADGDRTLGSGPGHEAHTPLQLATRAGHVDVVAALLESGANPGARDVFGQTPLHYGAAFGHADCCVALLRYGSDPLALDASGHAPAALAKAAGHAQLARKARVEAGGVIAAQTRVPLRVLLSCLQCSCWRPRPPLLLPRSCLAPILRLSNALPRLSRQTSCRPMQHRHAKAPLTLEVLRRETGQLGTPRRLSTQVAVLSTSPRVHSHSAPPSTLLLPMQLPL